jgi:hypothetical protein
MNWIRKILHTYILPSYPDSLREFNSDRETMRNFHYALVRESRASNDCDLYECRCQEGAAWYEERRKIKAIASRVEKYKSGIRIALR